MSPVFRTAVLRTAASYMLNVMKSRAIKSHMGTWRAIQSRTVLLRTLLSLTLLTALLVACTRERPAPDFLPTIEVDAEAAADSAVAESAPASQEPQIATEPSITQTESITDPLGLDTEPEPTATTTPSVPETFSYTVQPGDTLTELATRFETDITTLRRLNALDSEALAVGQPLEIPYIEGMTAAGAPTPTPGPFYYTVQAGDTLSGIAARFGADAIQLVETNEILDPNNLVVGSEILIPGYAPAAATAGDDSESDDAAETDGDGARFVHIVQPGEGLLDIAAQYGVETNDIAVANNLVNRNVLRVGQELVIPGISARDAAISSGAVHIVQEGESLLGIALRYGVTVEEIMEFNEIVNANSITVGQQLIIPRE